MSSFEAMTAFERQQYFMRNGIIIELAVIAYENAAQALAKVIVEKKATDLSADEKGLADSLTNPLDRILADEVRAYLDR